MFPISKNPSRVYTLSLNTHLLGKDRIQNLFSPMECLLFCSRFCPSVFISQMASWCPFFWSVSLAPLLSYIALGLLVIEIPLHYHPISRCRVNEVQLLLLSSLYVDRSWSLTACCVASCLYPLWSSTISILAFILLGCLLATDRELPPRRE